MNKRSVLVTGASGFIGKGLCPELLASGFNVRVALRKPSLEYAHKYDSICVGDINCCTDWSKAFNGVDTIIHLAARVHITPNSAAGHFDTFRKINVLGTERLARMAANAGVKRFIFISSVKVNGEGASRPYTENDLPNPQDAYAISKMEAEQVLSCIAAESGLQIVVLRLPLVYGPGVKANFKNLIKIAGSGLPLPFKGISNRRSFVYLGNLVDAIITCATHPLAAGQTFLVSDGQDISTLDLIKMIALAMNKKPVLFSLHPYILKMLCKIIGKSEEVEKLTGTLFVDSNKIRNLLGWKPPFSIEEGIKETVKDYKAW